MPRSKRSASSEFDLEGYGDEADFGGANSASGSQFKQLAFDVLARWHWLALGLILGLLGGFYYFSKAPKIYQATSTLLVTQGGGEIAGSRDSDQLDLRSTEGMNTLAVRIKRLEFLTKVATKLKGNPAAMKNDLIPPAVDWFPEWSREWIGEKGGTAPPDPEQLDPIQLARYLASWTNVGIVEFTRLIEITVSHPDAEIASLVANTIATEYEAELAEERKTGLRESSGVLDVEAQELEREIQRKRESLDNYKTSRDALAEFTEAEKAFDRTQEDYKEQHPRYQKDLKRLEKRREEFLTEFKLVRNSAFDQAYWEEKVDELDDPKLSEDDKIRARRRLLESRATSLIGELGTQEKIAEELAATSLRKKADESSDAIGVEGSSMSQVPGSPAEPQQGAILSQGAFIGFGCGLLFVLLLVKLDNQIHTIPQVENLTNLPVLATIRLIEPRILRKIIKDKGKTEALAHSPAKNWDPHIVFRPGLSETLYAEMFRILRASVSLLGDEKKRNVTLFSSVLPGEGKTLISTNFAIASAQQGKKTLLLDFDLRKPAVHKAFGYKRSELKPGATELLAGQITWQEALSKDTGQKNLTCIFSGKKAPNPGELLNSDTVSELLQSLETEFDVIVIDSAPLLAVPDTRLIIPKIDNFCLVIRAEQTPVGAIRKGLGLMEDDGTEPAGLVVNAYEEKAGFLTRKYRYGYGYGGYGQYYGKGYGYGKQYGGTAYGTYGSDDDDD